MNRIHLWVGIISLIVFVLQGQYMAWGLGLLQAVPDGPRMMLRSAHLYLFLTGAINIALGSAPEVSPPDKLEKITSIIFILSPSALLVSFFVESYATNLNRPIAAITLQLVFAAIAVRALRALGFGHRAS